MKLSNGFVRSHHDMPHTWERFGKDDCVPSFSKYVRTMLLLRTHYFGCLQTTYRAHPHTWEGFGKEDRVPSLSKYLRTTLSHVRIVMSAFRLPSDCLQTAFRLPSDCFQTMYRTRSIPR